LTKKGLYYFGQPHEVFSLPNLRDLVLEILRN